MAISSYLVGGCMYTLTWSGEIGGLGVPTSTCDVTQPISIKQTQVRARNKRFATAMSPRFRRVGCIQVSSDCQLWLSRLSEKSSGGFSEFAPILQTLGATRP